MHCALPPIVPSQLQSSDRLISTLSLISADITLCRRETLRRLFRLLEKTILHPTDDDYCPLCFTNLLQTSEDYLTCQNINCIYEWKI